MSQAKTASGDSVTQTIDFLTLKFRILVYLQNLHNPL